MRGTWKWLILEYMRQKNAFGRSEDEFVTKEELLRALGISRNTLNRTLSRMEFFNWVVGYPKKYSRNRFYCLGSRALSFLKRYPDFIHHKYFAGFQEAEVV